MLSFRRAKLTRLGRKQLVLIHLFAALLAASPYIKNWAVYGNPFWPVRVPFAGNAFPYVVDSVAVGANAQRPAAMKGRQVVVFVNSLFEIGHPTEYKDRARWIIDQGGATTAFRMGGFWGNGVIYYLLATLVLFVLHDRRRGIVAGVSIVAVLGFVAVLPQSNELRYYLFLPLSWAAAIRMTFPSLQARRRVRPRLPGHGGDPLRLHGERGTASTARSRGAAGSAAPRTGSSPSTGPR